MNELLTKISSYNLFNYLLPGVLFVVLAEAWTDYSFAQDNILVAAFVYYFIGMVISRLGSLIIEPILKSVGFVKFAEYADFVKASSADPKIEILSEANNSYRTLCAVFAALCLIKLYAWIEGLCPILSGHGGFVLILLLLSLFLFSYRKQTAYITKRIRTKD
ncbi:hypothetical protein Plav_0316 [Parvibaculum lavamentivorans DS-1]|uniref:Uncharacterized protein n=1 Tax=Parvibaculum lavamentivorans (strain DS-1 / DSM 13023 / NCIMB 13966) TaxID=402881 RepID=A7HPV6_PARL1|nr:hypothetical protein [Parvibaculum lavamentivorans]ABS61939.1 hypothetical protein Plav_0316 [Parvibaculum lavamentivorans DS-1]